MPPLEGQTITKNQSVHAMDDKNNHICWKANFKWSLFVMAKLSDIVSPMYKGTENEECITLSKWLTDPGSALLTRTIFVSHCVSVSLKCYFNEFSLF